MKVEAKFRLQSRFFKFALDCWSKNLRQKLLLSPLVNIPGLQGQHTFKTFSSSCHVMDVMCFHIMNTNLLNKNILGLSHLKKERFNFLHRWSSQLTLGWYISIHVPEKVPKVVNGFKTSWRIESKVLFCIKLVLCSVEFPKWKSLHLFLITVTDFHKTVK